MLQQTTAQKKISKLTKRIRVVQGGTSASKTFTIIPLLISYAAKNPKLEISIVSESIPHLRRGAVRDFVKIMQWTGNWVDGRFNKSHLTYTFSNGSRVEFFSTDNGDKLRGARRHILFVNEAHNIPFEAYYQLAIRTSKVIFIDFNPSHEFWAHTELQNDPDAEWLTLTYKDNEATPIEVIKELKKAEEKAKTSDYWRNWVDVYVYGRLGTRQGVIFQEHQAWHKIDAIPKNARIIGYGLDFGYSNDPTAIVVGYKYDGKIIYDEVCYQTLMSNAEIAQKLKANQLDRVQGWADSAEPKSIAQIQEAGCLIDGVEKGADSIRYGLALMQEDEFFVTSRSLNLIKELRSYSYAKKDNKKLNKPEPNQQDHAIDSARYLRMMTGGKRQSELIFV